MTRSFGAADGTGESVRNEMKQKLKTGTFRSVVRAVLHCQLPGLDFARKRNWLPGKTKVGDPCMEPY